MHSVTVKRNCGSANGSLSGCILHTEYYTHGRILDILGVQTNHVGVPLVDQLRFLMLEIPYLDGYVRADEPKLFNRLLSTYCEGRQTAE